MLIEKNNNASIDKCKMQISAYSMQGRRTHMEDCYDIGYLMKPAKLQKPNEWPYEYFYFGVFDGHGGYEAASFAKENLLKLITKQKEFWSDDDDEVLDAIRKGFAETHEAMLVEMPKWLRTNRVLPSTAGTTASILIIKNGKFYTGHVGDSRIVISSEHPETKNWHHEELTQDHKPENEIERIESVGGQVKAKIGVHRVVWRRPVLRKELEEKLTADPRHPGYDLCLGSVASYPIDEALVHSYQTIPFLAIARSLGDFWSFNPDNGEYVVSPEPDVMCRPINERDKCILLATDGLWNVMNSSQAIRFLQELQIVKRGERDSKAYSNFYFATDNFYDVSTSDEENHALSLVYMAYQIWGRRRLRSDNITAVVAMLSDILTPQRSTSNNQSTENHSRAYTEAYIENHGFQLGEARLVYQDVYLDKKPAFKFGIDDITEEMFEDLDDYILLPPYIMNTRPWHSNVKPPRNLIRLSNAKCRMLQRDDHSDEYIYIKEVSDDPSDSVSNPSRKNSKSVEVRDSSAQASQSIHDFGQQWVRESSEMTVKSQETPELDESIGKRSNKSEDCTEKRRATVQRELENPVDSGEDHAVAGRVRHMGEVCRSVNLDEFTVPLEGETLAMILGQIRPWVESPRPGGGASDIDDPPINNTTDQVLSVVTENRTPVTGRYTRRSATENSKRKLEIEMVECPKTKRRKSHPIHSVAAATKG